MFIKRTDKCLPFFFLEQLPDGFEGAFHVMEENISDDSMEVYLSNIETSPVFKSNF